MEALPHTHDGRSGWPMVLFLCLLAALSYLDRYIVALLADPISRALGIGVTDIGLLIGLGFGLVYALCCVPLGHWLDRGRRVWIVGAGVMLWSLSTVASAFASGFTALLVTRSGVAIGEALLVPATVSLVGDLFPADRRALPIGLFMAVSSLMGSGAFVIGGAVYRAAQAWGPAPWRLTLLLIGAPGVLLALVWLAVMQEPVRGPGGATEPSLAALRAHLARHWRFYAPFLPSFGASAVASYGFISWSVTMLIRSYHLGVSAAGSYYGSVGMVASAAAALFWPALLGAATRRGRADLGLLFLAAGLGLANLLVAGLVFAHALAEALAIMAGASFGYAAAGGLAVLIVQRAAPAGLRAKLTSLYMLLGNLVGLVCGPPATAWLSEHAFSGSDAIRTSLAVIAAGFGMLAVVLIGASYPGYCRLLRDA